jgi:hypothetical protein
LEIARHKARVAVCGIIVRYYSALEDC